MSHNKNGSNDSKNQNNNDSIDLIVARLGYIGAIIATLGDGIAAIAAGIALRALEEETFSESRSEVDQLRQTESVQQQIDFYINELVQIRKMIK
ncbi:translation initiation factor 2 [Paenibacillus glycanilyticus]|uniref:translation initiation factor 2 n=1 Tax=Paenibacillus glycanilyticus TaxID=126569 RepID=UPI00203EF0E9|nr:translation initiation factor 2 [Paenibacillus glycanilyticus]MCM3631133.1 translation initiation factor 2 [Paenibacillus glycanilyticus]